MPYEFEGLDIYRLGEDGSGTKLRSGDGFQDFEKIRAECLASGTQFEDPEFPLNPALLAEMKPDDVFFKRPQVIQTEWFKDGKKVCFSKKECGDNTSICRFDICQGFIGDCGFLASMSSAFIHERVIRIVFPSDNSFEEGKYCGAFHFRVHWFGRWLDMVIDDRIPVNVQSFPHGDKPRLEGSIAEYWPCLIEKLWAKFSGNYDGQKMGGGIRHLESLTAGMLEYFPLNLDRAFSYIKDAAEFGVSGVTAWPKEYKGLITGHAYALTGGSEIETKDGQKVQLLRFRNPWGHNEFTGDWSDDSTLWDNVSEETKEKLKLVEKDDGEFWIAFDYVKSVNDTLTLCHLVPEELPGDAEKDIGWNYEKYTAQPWTEAHADGSCGEGTQFTFTVDKEGGSRAIFGFMTLGSNYGGPAGTIRCGYKVYDVTNEDEADDGLFPASTFESKDPVTEAEETLGVDFEPVGTDLDPGTYCVLVHADKLPSPPFEEFLLKIFWEK